MSLEKEIVNVFNSNNDETTINNILRDKYDVDKYDDSIGYYIGVVAKYKRDNGFINLDEYDFEIDKVREAVRKICSNIEQRRKNIIVSGASTYDILIETFKMSSQERKIEVLTRQFGLDKEEAISYIHKFKEYPSMTFSETHTLDNKDEGYDLGRSSIENNIQKLAAEIDNKTIAANSALEDQTKTVESNEVSQTVQNSPLNEATSQAQKTQPRQEATEASNNKEVSKEKYIKEQLKMFFTQVPYRSQAACLSEAFNMPLPVADALAKRFSRIGTPIGKRNPNPTTEAAKMLNAQYDNFYDSLDYAYSIIERYATEYNNSMSKGTVRK